jgi:hypothetical protein
MLADTHRKAGKQLPLIFFYWYDTGSESFMLQIVTGDETLLHHFVPEVKLRLTEGCHIVWRNKKFKSVLLMGRMVAVVVWCGKGAILLTFLLRQTRMKYDHFIKILRTRNACLFHNKQNVRSPWPHNATHKKVHHWDHHKIWMGNFCTHHTVLTWHHEIFTC